MNASTNTHDTAVIERAMNDFFRHAHQARRQCTRIRANMEYRRKLEVIAEQRRLAREIAEWEAI
jgi:hypothetical protein